MSPGQVSDRGLLVLIPAWNEQHRIRHVVDEVRRTLPRAAVLVVDDGSDDGTGDVARAAGADVLTLPYNLGVGGAVRVGFRFAADHGYRTVVRIDGDGQHDPAEVPALVTALREADVVVGARFAGKGDYELRGPRRWAIGVLSWTVSRSTGTHLTDATSGFRAFGSRAIELFARTHPVEYLGDTVETLIIAGKVGLRVGQVPVAMRPRAGGDPSHSWRRGVPYLLRALGVLIIAELQSWTSHVEPGNVPTGVGGGEEGP